MCDEPDTPVRIDTLHVTGDGTRIDRYRRQLSEKFPGCAITVRSPAGNVRLYEVGFFAEGTVRFIPLSPLWSLEERAWRDAYEREC